MRTLTAFLLILAGLSLAQPESFRSMSTGGMILDDIDMWMRSVLGLVPMPDRLLEVEGHRVYTGLANLSNGDDTALDEDSTGEGGFLVGGSADLGAAAALGGFGDFFDHRIFEEISIPGPGGTLVSGEGEVEGSWSEYVDEDGDGVYDTRHTEYQHVRGWSDSTSKEFNLLGGWAPNEGVNLGLGVGYFTNETEAIPSDLNVKETVSDSNLVSGIPTYLMSSESEGSESRSGNGIGVALSGRGGLSPDMTGGAVFMFVTHSVDQSTTTSASGSEDDLPSQPDVFDDLTWQSSSDYTIDMGGNTFGGGAELSYDVSPDWTLDVVGGYLTTSIDGSSDDYGVSADSTYRLTQGSLTEVTDIVHDGPGSLDAEYKESSFRAGLRLSSSPVERLTVAMGAFFESEDNSNTQLAYTSNTIVETFDDGDSEFADPDDYTATTTWSQTEELKTTTELQSIRLPVGLEFGVLPRVAARLGARPGFVWETETETESLISASPMRTHTVYGDGSESESSQSPWETYDGTAVTTEDSRTEIPLYYGIGIAPSDFLQIDLMGVSEDPTEWRVSATLKF
ncbi:hypothetical protein GF402_05475 [Candidatus Fermentibacteria bacterium]|nr:hypothetical protein [Candidatus Fermentibacteria bacterium]